MRIWRRWFGKAALSEEITVRDGRSGQSMKHEEAQLRAELRQLVQRRQVIELRGCFSDRELNEKDCELERLDQRIKALKSQQFRLRTQGKI
jgi:hypothetical protein